MDGMTMSRNTTFFRLAHHQFTKGTALGEITHGLGVPKGTVFAAGDKLEVLSHNDLGEPILATPALVDGRVYVRTETHLYAFGG